MRRLLGPANDGLGTGGAGSLQQALAGLFGPGFTALTKIYIPALIVQVHRDDGLTGPTNPVWPDEVRYTARAIVRTGVQLDEATPVYGRPVRGREAKVYPAQEGQVCWIVRIATQPDVLGLMPGSEVVWRQQCEQAAASSMLDEANRIASAIAEAGLGDETSVLERMLASDQPHVRGAAVLLQRRSNHI